MERFCMTPLKKARVLAGFRQGDVARLLGQSPSWYCQRESGHLPVSASDARKLSEILETPVEELFGEVKK